MLSAQVPGVAPHVKSGKWQAFHQFSSKQFFLGLFDDAESAFCGYQAKKPIKDHLAARENRGAMATRKVMEVTQVIRRWAVYMLHPRVFHVFPVTLRHLDRPCRPMREISVFRKRFLMCHTKLAGWPFSGGIPMYSHKKSTRSPATNGSN